MSVLEVSKFGPIDKLKMDVNRNLNIVIGPQASGKSTIGKVLYFCKKIRDYYIDFILQDTIFIQTHPNELYINFLKYIRKNFMGCFGTTKHMESFVISYTYDGGDALTISLREGYAFFRFSYQMENEIRSSLLAAHEIYKGHRLQNEMDYVANFNSRMQLKTEIKTHFTQLAYQIFGTDEDVIYIPAGRSLLSVLSDQLDAIDISILDLPMKEFIERIRATRTRFGTKIDGVVNDYLKTVQGQIKNTDIYLAKKLIKNILKAEYVNDIDGEKLYFDDSHWVKLIYGSSGQQESLWILLLLFVVILENKKAFIILEEPEAHLYPIAQRYIVELIALTINSSGSDFFITTHSPYVMSSTNLLIQSAIVENQAALKNEEPVVKKQFRISPQKVAAYKIMETDAFEIKNIVDLSSGMVESMEIDTISEWINADTEKLDELEIKYGL
ncbi:MAG: ATP-binding protein [Clostridium sp.]|nr:ATP-binding protein [Clostridium sp.]